MGNFQGVEPQVYLEDEKALDRNKQKVEWRGRGAVVDEQMLGA